MAGKKMRVTPNDMAFATSPLQFKTVQNWSQSVLDIDMLEMGIKRELNDWIAERDVTRERHLRIKAVDTILFGFLCEQMALLTGAEIIGHFILNPDTIINETDVHRELMRTSVSAIDWAKASPFKLLLLIGTYRTIIQRTAGIIPGLDGNITIAGCVYTCFRLGVPVEA